jgi:hypothetical protein
MEQTWEKKTKKKKKEKNLEKTWTWKKIEA